MSTYYDLPENLTILGSYTDLEALQTAHPSGSAGDIYLVTSIDSEDSASPRGQYYTWSVVLSSWVRIPDQQIENKLVNLSLTSLPIPHITGLKLKGDISIGNLVLNTIDTTGDTAGVVWVCSELDGWWTIPDPEFPELTRGWGDGSYDANGRYAARILTLTGSFLTQTPEQVEPARKKLLEAIDLVYRGATLRVNEVDRTRESDGTYTATASPKVAFVRLSGRPEIVSTKARGRHDFTIGLKAPDHVKYEYVAETYRTATLSRGQNTTLVNTGNTRTPFIFELSGATASGEELTITNEYTKDGATVTESITGIRNVSSSYTTEIDTYNRNVIRVTRSGGVVTSKTVARGDIDSYVDWLQLYPGNNKITFTSSGTSTVSCKINYRSGWIG